MEAVVVKIGLYDVDSHNFPNLVLMKLSAYHKAQGDAVEWADFFEHYDRVYVSKIFGNEYTSDVAYYFNADEVIYGGTGYAISIQSDMEVYEQEKDASLPYEVEHIYPDYGLYPELTKDKAYGFLTRGCSNNCGFCIVSQKEGCRSVKVADLSEFWRGQKEVVLLDPNLLACDERIELLQQLIDSGVQVDFTQGLDARFVTREIALLLKEIKCKMIHFAFDIPENEEAIMRGLKNFVTYAEYDSKRRNCYVYVLTNYNTTFEEDYRRVQLIRECGLDPDIRIYRKPTVPQILKDLQRWCNNRFIYRSTPDFMKYIPRSDGKTIEELYFGRRNGK